MSQKYEKLKTLLKELFQLDQPELDFGIYRILHARSAEVTQFLDKDLLPQVKQAFAQYRTADKAELEKELAKAIEAAQALGVDPESTQKVKDLRARLASDAVDTGALEAEVYDHLYSFFRRYYSEGDFLSKRVYKPGVYAIPYEGEEVKLHWANADQYYIKTSESFRDYAFRLRPEDEANPMRVHFRLADAAEGEHGNVKEQAGKERRFRLAPAPFAAIEDGELVIRFTYKPETEKQKDLNAEAEAAILALDDPALADWIKALGGPHVRADGTASENTRLRVHLDRYTARNTFDYFIHKDLGGFLRRELDFYIKNEVMHLDDVESETAPRVEQYLSKIKVIRRIAHKIIDFLAQLEDFQKKLWLKKKFVVETSYCIRLGVIPEEFYPEIAANDAQREEWVRLCAIDELKATEGSLLDSGKPGYSVPLTVEFLKAHPTLVVDTKLFSTDLAERMLDAVCDLDGHTDAVLLHSENSQALRHLITRYADGVDCIYADPPYNTSEIGFNYKNEYRHSSWCTMIAQAMSLAQRALRTNGVMATAIDDCELHHLGMVCDEVLGRNTRLGTLVVEIKPSGRTNDNFLATSHEYYLLNSRDPSAAEACFFPLSEEQQQQYSEVDDKGSHKWRDFLRTGGYSTPQERPNSFYPIYFEPQSNQISLEKQAGWEVIWPIDSEGRKRVWRKTRPSFLKHLADGEIRIVSKRGGGYKVEIIDRIKDGVRPKSVWVGKQYDASSHGTKLLKSLFGETSVFSFPKSLYATKDVLFVATGDTDEGIVLDYFAGSGTTGHAVVSLNREDGGQRKFILVEQGDHFDTVLLPRLKKVTFTPEWRGGRPKRLATAEEAERSPRIMKVIRLESYEDTLNNLELRRTEAQQSLLDSPQAQGADGFREQYLLRYMLDVETRGSQSLLNVSAFMDPTAYRLKVKRPGSDESREVNVDLLETFNWLIGLKVVHIAAPRTCSAAFRRDDDPDLPADAPRRLLLDGRLKEDPDGPWWFRTVTGTTPDGRRTLVIWRKRPGGEEPEGIERDNLVLDEWFRKQGYSSKDSEFDLIYVNGDNNLENLKAPDDTWKVRLIEEDFFRLMFEMEGV
ncbi:site-specific DNA-methyltransferase [Burkholderia multivorans]|uniref:site-specific DNA-methyltransferase n=1 Tax=Burkholderia multivorans TaxID=87883 RepID=UPI000D00CA3D|nr:DNA methyltransferase [Burkholderia multivorans]PRH15796.1 site-specific DNA-methyltransferase [Burkholderia multivorans]